VVVSSISTLNAPAHCSNPNSGGQHHCVKYAAPHIGPGGSITLFSGWVSRKPMLEMSTLAAVDGAIEALARNLALELAPIRVNAITPGQIDTPLWRGFIRNRGQGIFRSSCAIPSSRPRENCRRRRTGHSISDAKRFHERGHPRYRRRLALTRHLKSLDVVSALEYRKPLLSYHLCRFQPKAGVKLSAPSCHRVSSSIFGLSSYRTVRGN